MRRTVGLVVLALAVLGVVAVIVWVVRQPRGDDQLPPEDTVAGPEDEDEGISVEASGGEVVHRDEDGEVVWSVKFGGTPGGEPADPTGIVVNEVLSHTDYPQRDAVELHNTTARPIDIGGWYLSDDWGWDTDLSDDNYDNYKKFRIPDGTSIAAGDYVTFYDDMLEEE